MCVGPGTTASHGCATRERCMTGILKGRRHIQEAYRCTEILTLLFSSVAITSSWLLMLSDQKYLIMSFYCEMLNVMLQGCILCRLLKDFDVDVLSLRQSHIFHHSCRPTHLFVTLD